MKGITMDSRIQRQNLADDVESCQLNKVWDLEIIEETNYFVIVNKMKWSMVSSEDDGSEHEDCNFSLSVAATNLPASAETDLRRTLGNKLSKVSYLAGCGNFLSLGLSSSDDTSNSAVCYYNVLSLSSPPVVDDDDDDVNTNKQFVVCFVSFSDTSLDLFRLELDNYCKCIVKHLDSETILSDYVQPTQPLTQIDSKLKEYLNDWHESVLEYLKRCVDLFGDKIYYLVFTALLDGNLMITGASPEVQEDINKFIQCCSISPLVEQLQSETDDTLVDVRNQPIIKLHLDSDNIIFDTNGNIPCNFCKLAGDHLLTIDSNNITKLRDSLESVKLAFIHNLNKVKRFLKQAEIDHYALYRSYLYLRKCGSGELLLRYVKLDASTGTLSVLKTLEEFIENQGTPLQ